VPHVRKLKGHLQQQLLAARQQRGALPRELWGEGLECGHEGEVLLHVCGEDGADQQAAEAAGLVGGQGRRKVVMLG
jgi:hypothetical protein